MAEKQYAHDDPLRYLEVPESERLDSDGGEDSDAITDGGDADDVFNRDEVRNRGGIVRQEDLA